MAQARDGRGYEDRADGTALDGFGCALTEQPIRATGMPGLAVLQDKCRAPVMAEMAICAGMSPYGGTMLEGVIGTAASLHLFCALERMPLGCALFGSDLATDRITTTALSMQDGVLLLNAGPGLGVEIDKAKLARYRRPEAPARSVA